MLDAMFHIKSNDGTKIAVYDPNPTGKETVLLIHGWPLSHLMYEYQVDLLIKHDYRVITLDLRGFGNSDAPAGCYSYDQMARDIHVVVRTMGLSNFVLCGYSMGGAIVLRYMHIYDGFGVKKLMLLAAAAPSWAMRQDFPCGLPVSQVDDLIDQACTDRPQLAWDFSHEMLFASPHGEPLKNWFEDISLSASGIATIMTAFSLRDEDGREDIKHVHVPTAVFQGAKDQVVLKELTEYQHEHIPGSKLYTLENSAHGVFYDELEKFNEYFMEFLCS